MNTLNLTDAPTGAFGGVAPTLTLFVIALLLVVIWVAAGSRAPRPSTFPTGLLAIIPEEGAQAPNKHLWEFL